LMKILTTSLVAISLLTQSVSCWGALGHELTGGIAQHLISAQTAFDVKQLLPSAWQGRLKRSSTWADEVRNGNATKVQYAWSANLHFVDINDNPPKSCGYIHERDCPNNFCVVGAIANYTKQLDCTLPKPVRSEALKFLSHFIGDITQPLHTCAREIGGNNNTAMFDGITMTEFGPLNLHAIWDTNILEKRLKNNFGGSYNRYLNYMLSQAYGKYRKQWKKWNACLNNDDEGDDATLECAKSWAADSDALDCEVVWGDFDADRTQDLGKAYYQKVWPVAEQQLIKAGVRMAAWFNKYLKSCSTSDNGKNPVQYKHHKKHRKPKKYGSKHSNKKWSYKRHHPRHHYGHRRYRHE